ncbi:MAG: ADP-ribosylglycohydrolase family protein [Mycobacteriales bacterium]|nr:ADP-ribosylglycohydrolase family protein [Mycobacteriales bacterium]
MRLDSTQTDRAVGVLMGQAAGDALGVPYEYGSRTLTGEPQMLGGGLGGIAPGQWSDDTEMALCIADVAATGADLRTDEAQEAIAAGFLRWYADNPPDVGVQTRQVLSASRGQGATAMRGFSERLHEQSGRTAGNGSLMRTGPVALAHLGDTDAIVEAARLTSALTHHDPVAGDACALWCLAIDHAVRTGELDVRVGLPHVDEAYWAPLLAEAETVDPSHYRHSNGWVVAALLGAWSAISRTDGLVAGLHAAVAGGGDTDTVAAIAGQLLGARYGGSAVPARYRRLLHGWPGMRSRDLARLAVLTTRGGQPARHGWPSAPTHHYDATPTAVVVHPDDPGVLLGAIGAVRPGVADAVVSLCRMGRDEVPLAGVAPEDHVEFWLVDEVDANLDPGSVLRDAAATVAALRAEGKTVLLHCVAMHSRTPLVAAVYGALVTGDSVRESLDRVEAALPVTYLNPDLLEAALA